VSTGPVQLACERFKTAGILFNRLFEQQEAASQRHPASQFGRVKLQAFDGIGFYNM